MRPTGFIAVKDFERFQHYKGRTPPWIKFYNALLDDYRFLQLSDAARSQLMLIWLVASRHRNRIPNDVKYITQAIHCTTRLQLAALIDSGWLYLANDAPLAEPEQDASKVLAIRPQNATPEVETEKEIEGETETTSSISARESLLEKMDDEYRDDVQHFLTALGGYTRQTAWCKNFEAVLSGMHPPTVSAVTLGAALRQLVANGDRPNWKLFEGYLRGVTALPPSRNGKPPTAAGKPAWQTAKERRDRDEAMNRDEDVQSAVRVAREENPAWWERMTAEAKTLDRWATVYAFENLESGTVNA